MTPASWPCPLPDGGSAEEYALLFDKARDKRLLIVPALLLAGCGAADGLKPAKGEALPPAPYGAAKPKTPDELLTPAKQARPQRSDELLKSSDERRQDEFDLPPAS